MARQKKYTAATLGKACECYFAAITRRVKVTEMVDSGKRCLLYTSSVRAKEHLLERGEGY